MVSHGEWMQAGPVSSHVRRDHSFYDFRTPQVLYPFFILTLTYHILDVVFEAVSYETPRAGRLIKERAAISLPLKNSGEEWHNSGTLQGPKFERVV